MNTPPTAPLVPFTHTPEGLTLMPHQQEAVERALRNRQYLIAHEQGTGKTITGIMLAQSLVQNGVRPVLVVVPPSLRVNWRDEFAKWAPSLSIAELKQKAPLDLRDAPYAGLPSADVILATDGTLAGYSNWYIGGPRTFTWDEVWAKDAKGRFLRDDKGQKVRRVNADGSPFVPTYITRDFGMGVGALIVDECQRVSSTRGTARTGAFVHVGQERDEMPKFLLSGTPFTKSRVNLSMLMRGLGGLWSRHTRLVDEVLVPCTDSKEWLDEFAPAIGTQGQRGVAHTERLHDEMFDGVWGWAHRVRTADVITDLPDMGRVTVSAGLSGEWAKRYREADRDLASWLVRCYGSDKAERMMRAEALSRIQELRRLVGRAKIESVAEQVSLMLDVPEGEDREQVLVMCSHTFVRETLMGIFAKQGWRVGTIHGGMTAEAKQKVVRQWQAGELDVVVANVVSASVGFTMTAGRHCVFAEIPWSSSDLLQSESRLLRLGQSRTVVSTVTVGSNGNGGRTIDHDLWSVVQAKFGEAKGVLDGEYEASLTDADKESIAMQILRARARNMGLAD